MRHRPSKPTPAAAFFLAAAVVGLGISLYLYFMPLTGVTQSLGALLVCVSCGLLALAAVVLIVRPVSTLSDIFRGLAFLGAIGTLVAAWFLHATWLLVAMAFATILLIIDMIADKGEPA
jgi:hypothetical protein